MFSRQLRRPPATPFDSRTTPDSRSGPSLTALQTRNGSAVLDSASVGAPAGRPDPDRLVALVRTAQRLGGDGARLLLSGGTGSDTEAADLVVLLRSLVHLSATFGVVLALDPSGSASSSRAVSCALHVPGVTVVGSSTDLGSPFDGVLWRAGAGGPSGLEREAGWQIRRQSELLPAGA